MKALNTNMVNMFTQAASVYLKMRQYFKEKDNYIKYKISFSYTEENGMRERLSKGEKQYIRV